MGKDPCISLLLVLSLTESANELSHKYQFINHLQN